MRAEGERRLWQLAASSHPHVKVSSQRENVRRLDPWLYAGQRRRTAHEFALGRGDTRAAMLMIASGLKVNGKKWAERHPREMHWLRAQGLTAQEAIRRHDEWFAAELARPWEGQLYGLSNRKPLPR